jgi:DNA polymerase (family 10)
VAYQKGGIKALTAIPGIGAALSQKIAEYIETGRMHKYEEVIAQRPKEQG